MVRRQATRRLGGMAALLAGVVGAALVAAAGPLDPPAGPVAPTHKTLSEVEPRIAINAANTPGDADSVFRITQPGSYYLVGNVAGVPGRSGIEIASGNVTVDLVGFTVAGVVGSLDGIVTDGARDLVVVRNGIVAGWGADGIDLTQAGVSVGSIVEDVIVSSSAGDGIRVGDSGLVRRCVSRQNGAAGIFAGAGAAVVESSALNSSGDGIVVGANGLVTLSIAYNSTGDGIVAGEGANVRRCTVGFCDGDGIFLARGGSAEECVVEIIDGVGIRTPGPAMVAGCTVRECLLDGIVGGSGSTVTACLVWGCIGDGIVFANDCTVSYNSSIANGALAGNTAGILATGLDNRIEFNTCARNGLGIECTTSGNFVAANICGDNDTDWSLAANNRFGAIFNITTLEPPAVTGAGSAASGIAGASDAFANFSY